MAGIGISVTRQLLVVCLWAVLGLALGGSPVLAGGGAAGGLPGLPAAAPAAETPAPPAALDSEIKLLVGLLSDPRLRQWLDEQARRGAVASGSAGAQGGEADLSGGLKPIVEMIQKHIADQVHAIEVLPVEYAFALDIWEAEGAHEVLEQSLLFVGIFLAVGVGAELLFRRLVRDVWLRILAAPRGDWKATLGRTAMRGLLNLFSVGLFAVGSVGTFLIFHWHPILELFVVSFLSAVIIIRLFEVVSSFVLAPHAACVRLVPVDTPLAMVLHRWVLALAVVGASGFLFCQALLELGFLRSAHELLVSLIGLVLSAMLITMIWHTRGRVAALFRNEVGDHVLGAPEVGAPEVGDRSIDDQSADEAGRRFRANLADLYPIVGTLVILAVWGLWVIGAWALMWSLIIVVALPLVLAASRAVIGTVMASPATDPDDDAGDDGAAVYRPILLRAVTVLAVLSAMFAFVLAWRVNLPMLAQPGSPWAGIVRSAFNVILTLLVADLVWKWVNTVIDRRLKRHQPALGAHGLPDEGGGMVDEGARLRTLLPLVRNVIMVVLLLMVVMIVLSSLGVDIGPLLAGAGVVGLAIGFGAQALVRDIVSGIFFLVDDAFRVGEYIEIGNLRGTVEAISIRSLRLRHHRGAIHTLPFGEIRSMTNYSRDWIIMKLEFRVPFSTDLNLVKKIVKKVGAELSAHPEYAPHILETVKSQGVRRMEEFNMVVGVKFMTKPGEQWVIRREVYQRILLAFEAAGIRLASRNVVVEVTGERPSIEDIDRIAAAAIDATERPPSLKAATA